MAAAILKYCLKPEGDVCVTEAAGLMRIMGWEHLCHPRKGARFKLERE